MCMCWTEGVGRERGRRKRKGKEKRKRRREEIRASEPREGSQSSSFCRHHKALRIFNRHGFVMSKVKQNFRYYLMSHHEDP